MNDHLVEFIAADPGMADRLMREHVQDRSGRCRVCSSGAQAGRSAWPCTLHIAAVEARKRRTATNNGSAAARRTVVGG